MRRITLTGHSLVGLNPGPAQDIEVLLTTDEGRRVKRRYTISQVRADVGEWDIDTLLHGHGPGARWAAQVEVGEAADVLGPRGKLEIRPADWHLFVGDESAIPAFNAVAVARPPDEPAYGLIEVTDSDDELPLERTTVTWIHRRTEPAGYPDLLAKALRQCEPRGGVARAYLLGESRAMVALRPVVRDLGISDENIYLKGYWNIGRSPRRVAAERGWIH